MSIYRGFVPIGADKAAQMAYAGVDDSELLTEKQVQRMDHYAGVLAPGYVLVDADTEQDADALWRIIDEEDLNCLVYETTKGIHAIFRDSHERIKKATTGHLTACGIVVDYKHGDKNGLEVLKHNGEKRPVLMEPDGEPQEIPVYLLDIGPYKKGKKVVGTTFVGMGSGDGRNDELWKHILKLQGQGLSKDDIREVLRVINEHVFEEKVPQDEFEKITRDEAFKKAAFYVKGHFQHHTFGQFLINEYKLRKIDGQIHMYKDGVYLPGTQQVENAMIKEIDSIPNHERVEVLKYINVALENEYTMDMESDEELIAFNNGLLNILTGELEPFSPDHIILNRIPWDWDPNAKDDLLEQTLDKIACGDPDVRAVIEEMAGYCLYRRNELGKAFFLTGEGSNGKSTFLAMIKAMLGASNVTHLETDELGDRFNTAMLYGKLANLGDDISDEFMTGRKVSMFKKLVTGEPVKAENKGETPFTFTPTCKFLFSANTIPRIRDRSNGVLRRMVIIPFNAKFSKDDPDYVPHIKMKLIKREPIQALLVLAVEGLKRVLDTNGFTQGEKVEAEIEQFKQDNDTVLAWTLEVGPQSIENLNTKDAYRAYDAWCEDNGLVAVSNQWFGRKVKQHTGLESRSMRVGGKIVKVYTK